MGAEGGGESMMLFEDMRGRSVSSMEERGGAAVDVGERFESLAFEVLWLRRDAQGLLPTSCFTGEPQHHKFDMESPTGEGATYRTTLHLNDRAFSVAHVEQLTVGHDIFSLKQ